MSHSSFGDTWFPLDSGVSACPASSVILSVERERLGFCVAGLLLSVLL